MKNDVPKIIILKKNISSLVFLMLFVGVLFSSCARLIFGKTEMATNEAIFEDLWQNVDEKYPFFTYKNIDWDSVKIAYRPLIKPEMEDRELLDVLGGMLKELKDGHVNIETLFDRSRYWDWYLDEPTNFNFDLLEKNYLVKNNYQIAGPFIYAQVDTIGYIYYGSFSAPYTSEHLKIIFDFFKDTKGLVFDLRHNGGGRLMAMADLVSKFADEKRQVASYVFKKKEGREQFLDTIPIFSTPDENINYTKPLIVLTNRKSYSASTFFASAVQAFPHIRTMGDTTGGGGGVPTYFELKNGWRYRFSATITLDSKGNNIENGVPPDIPFLMGENDMPEGQDGILERAIELLVQEADEEAAKKKAKKERMKKEKVEK